MNPLPTAGQSTEEPPTAESGPPTAELAAAHPRAVAEPAEDRRGRTGVPGARLRRRWRSTDLKPELSI